MCQLEAMGVGFDRSCGVKALSGNNFTEWHRIFVQGQGGATGA
jgi:hypothetical protein